MVLALATDFCLRWEKLTPRFPRLPGLTMTGGLLGQCELAIDDRDTDLLLAADFCEGVECVLRFEDSRDFTEL